MANDRYLPPYDQWRSGYATTGLRRCPPEPSWPTMPGLEHCFMSEPQHPSRTPCPSQLPTPVPPSLAHCVALVPGFHQNPTTIPNIPPVPTDMDQGACWLLRTQARQLTEAYRKVIVAYGASVPNGQHVPASDDGQKLISPFAGLTKQIAAAIQACGVDPTVCETLLNAQGAIFAAKAWVVSKSGAAGPAYAFGPVMFGQQLGVIQAHLNDVKSAAGC